MDLTVVLPAYNEEGRIPVMLDQLRDYQATTNRSLEVVVVDDGSTDATGDVAQSYADRISELRVLRLERNQGKGAAVAAGMLAGRGRYRAFLDADGATPAAELDVLLAAIDRPRTVAIGSVACRGANVERHQTFSRRWAGRAANLLIRALVVPGIKDTQRGAKVFPAELCDRVFTELRSTGWGFDVEVLARCRAVGYRIVEVPVRWHHVDGGQIGAGSYLATFRELLSIRRHLQVEAAGARALNPAALSVPSARRLATGLAPLEHLTPVEQKVR